MDGLEFWQKPASDVRHTARMKQYLDGSYELMVSSEPVFREPGWEQPGWRAKPSKNGRKAVRKPDEAPQALPSDVERSMRRAAAKLRDLALSNEFRYFVTLTLDQTRIDRYDMAVITKALNGWLDNHVRRDGLAYILVPERHKDGAVHFHGFFNGALSAVDSGTLDVPGAAKPRKPRSAAQRAEWLAQGARVVYNLEAWPFGFSTAIELYGKYSSAVGYVCKYVRKQREKIGGRWWYHGGKLNEPTVSYPDVTFGEIEDAGAGYRFEIPGVAAFRIVRGGVEHGEGIGRAAEAAGADG